MESKSVVIVHNSDSELGALLSSANVFVLICATKRRIAQRIAALNYAANRKNNRHSQSVILSPSVESAPVTESRVVHRHYPLGELIRPTGA